MEISLPLSADLAERFNNLYQYYSRRYELEQLTVKLQDWTFSVFHISNIDQLLEELVGLGPESAEVKDERLPYWAELWPSSIGLAEFVLEESEITENDSVIELGCGVGLAGISVATRGAKVIISDYQKDALALAEMNWIVNLGHSPETVELDWRNVDIQNQFDYVIASDIVYEERFFKPILLNFDKLCSPSGKILLSEPNRKIAGPFFESLEQKGWQWHKRDYTVHHQEKEYHIAVYIISRRKP